LGCDTNAFVKEYNDESLLYGIPGVASGEVEMESVPIFTVYPEDPGKTLRI